MNVNPSIFRNVADKAAKKQTRHEKPPQKGQTNHKKRHVDVVSGQTLSLPPCVIVYPSNEPISFVCSSSNFLCYLKKCVEHWCVWKVAPISPPDTAINVLVGYLPNLPGWIRVAATRDIVPSSGKITLFSGRCIFHKRFYTISLPDNYHKHRSI